MSSASGVNLDVQIAHIIARVTPDETEMTNDAVSLVRKLLEQHLRLLVSTATERAMHERRSRLHGSDAVNALASLGYWKTVDLLNSVNGAVCARAKFNRKKYSHEITTKGFTNTLINVREGGLNRSRVKGNDMDEAPNGAYAKGAKGAKSSSSSLTAEPPSKKPKV